MLLNLLYGHGLFFTAIIVIGTSIVIALVGQWLTHRLVSFSNRRTHNDVIGFAAGTSGLIYVVLLAFIASTVWISYDRTDGLVEEEASLIGDLLNDAPLLPEPFASQSAVLLHDYVQEVVNEEWPKMARGERVGRQGWLFLRGFYANLGSVQTATPVQNAVVQEMLTRLNRLYDLRRERIRTSARPSLHSVIWFVVLAGGLITIAFSWLFGFEKKGLHKISTALIATMLGLVIFLIVAFNYPFRGQMLISVAPFEQILKHMNGQILSRH